MRLVVFSSCVVSEVRVDAVVVVVVTGVGAGVVTIAATEVASAEEKAGSCQERCDRREFLVGHGDSPFDDVEQWWLVVDPTPHRYE